MADVLSDPPARRSSRVPCGLLGMLAIILVVETSLASRPIAFSNVASWNRRFSAEAASTRSRGHDVLFLGDSLVKLGLVPKVIAAEGGPSSFNLAAASSPAPATYVVLRRAIDAGATPRAIVVDFGPGLLAADPEKDIRNATEVLGVGEFLELARTSRSVPFASSFAMQWILPTVRRRHEIRNVIAEAWRGDPIRQLEINRACLRNWLRNEGAHLAAVSTTTPVDAGPDTSAAGNLHVHRVNRAYVDRIFTLAKKHNIRAYWLLPPENPAALASRKRQGIEASYTKFVESVRARHPEITVLDARRSGYDASVFFDPSHLDVRGAVALSRTVARVLAEDPATPSRWVALDRPEFPASQPLPEDFEQSRVAIQIQREHDAEIR